jgi:hypothetical protein
MNQVTMNESEGTRVAFTPPDISNTQYSSELDNLFVFLIPLWRIANMTESSDSKLKLFFHLAFLQILRSLFWLRTFV